MKEYNKLNWLKNKNNYGSIRVILNKKKIEDMGFDRINNNEVHIEYDIENQTIKITPKNKKTISKETVVKDKLNKLIDSGLLEKVINHIYD